MKRVTLLAIMVTLLLVASLTVFAAGAQEEEEAPAVSGDWGSIDWQQFKGTRLNVLATAMPVAEIYKEHISQFEALTGIKVNIELLNDGDRRKKQIVDFSSGTGEYDVGNIGHSNRE